MVNAEDSIQVCNKPMRHVSLHNYLLLIMPKCIYVSVLKVERSFLPPGAGWSKYNAVAKHEVEADEADLEVGWRQNIFCAKPPRSSLVDDPS